jgi:hypothetical protein
MDETVNKHQGAEPLPDLQTEAHKIVEEFALYCNGRGQLEVFNAFVWLATRCLHAATKLIDINKPRAPEGAARVPSGAAPSDLLRSPGDPRCPLCRAAEHAEVTARELARGSTGSPSSSAKNKELH